MKNKHCIGGRFYNSMAMLRSRCGRLFLKWRISLFLLIMILTMAVLRFGSQVTAVWETDGVEKTKTGLEITKMTQTGDAVKVLEVAYMRGGSSLFGQLFYQNPEAFYWYEGLGGVYSQLYGVMPALVAMRFSHHYNGTARKLGDFEEQAVIQNIDDMLSCNVADLSADVLAHPFMFQSARIQNYTKCIRSNVATITGVSKSLSHVNSGSYVHCQKILTPVCSFNPDLPIRCYESLQSQTKMEPNGPFAKHRDCLSQLEKKVGVCLEHLQTVCSKSKVRAIKALRITMKTVATLVKQVPDIKIVHYVRDPRGIVKSRIAISHLSPHSHGKVTKEASLLCSKMLENLQIFRVLQAKYPDRTMQLRYEDLVMHPELTINQVYEFLGKRPPRMVETWIKKSMNASRSSGNFTYSRRNGTATAFAWRKTLPERDIIGISNICRQVLMELGYDIN